MVFGNALGVLGGICIACGNYEIQGHSANCPKHHYNNLALQQYNHTQGLQQQARNIPMPPPPQATAQPKKPQGPTDDELLLLTIKR